MFAMVTKQQFSKNSNYSKFEISSFKGLKEELMKVKREIISNLNLIKIQSMILRNYYQITFSPLFLF